MPERPSSFLSFLRNPPVLVVSLVLVTEILLFYLAPTAEHIPNPPPLQTFLTAVGDWRMDREIPLDPETQAFLKADDTLSRTYRSPEGVASLFVGFFKSQRAGVTPHSPKVCLPGSGWTFDETRAIRLNVPGEPGPIDVNRSLVSRGESRSVVYYWYATKHHVVAGEYRAKLLLMYEGMRYRRSDESIVRVIAPIIEGDEQRADALAVAFIRSLYEPLKRQMWSD